MNARHLCFVLVTVLLSASVHAQWVLTSGPYGGTVSCLAVAGDDLFAGTFGGGVFRSRDNGTTWGQTSLTNTNVYALAAVPDGKGSINVLAGTHDGLFCSTDDGNSWNKTVLTNAYVYSFAALPRDGGGSAVFAGTHGNGVLLSSDGGTSWLPAGLANAWIRCLLACGAVLFAGTSSDGILRSTDSGNSWVAVGASLPAGTSVNALVQCPDGSGRANIFAGTYGSGVVMSSDSGMTWYATNRGLADTCVYSLAAYGTNIFAGTECHGVSLLIGSETPWLPVNKGLADTSVYVLAANATYLFAGTFWAGVWRRPLPEFTSAVAEPTGSVPRAFMLCQNYPNPFNPETNIRYQIAPARPGESPSAGGDSRMVKLAVYDLLGREVSVLVNERKPAGSYEIKFDGSGLSSGVYFYRLSAGDFVEAKKLAIVK